MTQEQGSKEVNAKLVEMWTPVIDQLMNLTDDQIRQAIKPLEDRIAELEATVARLTDESKP